MAKNLKYRIIHYNASERRIMEEKQTIVALGAGSITKKVTRKTLENGSENTLIERCENVKEVAQYIERIDEMIERKRRLFHETALVSDFH